MEEKLYIGQIHDFVSQYGNLFYGHMSEEELKKEGQKIIDERNKELAKYGKESLEMLEVIKGIATDLFEKGIPQERISKAALVFPDFFDFCDIFITSDYRILLPNFDNVEIKLAPKTKALYFLFLRHKDGLFRKDLFQYGGELTEIMQAITHTKELSTPKKRAIEKLISKTDTQSFDDSCTEIKTEFLKHFSGCLASCYYISGERNQLRGISLPRAFIHVEWEDE